MAELRRTFSAGRMNKDIDERLLAPGEYRDALNVSVGNSESSDIGSVQNLKGNELIPLLQVELGGSDVEIDLGDATVVGSARYDLEEKIYYFVASSTTGFVDQYDYVGNAAGVVSITNNANGTATVRTRAIGSRAGALLSVAIAPDATTETALEVLTVQPGPLEGTNATFNNVVNGQYPVGSYSTVYQLEITQVPSEGDGSSYILEYDQSANIISPILSDTMGVLGFTPNNLITGINILGGQLFWTDDQTEPKKINIDRFKVASAGSITHTQVYGRDFVEDDITVIKKSPLNAPIMDVSETIRPGGGSFIANTSFDFGTIDDDVDIVGTTVALTVSSASLAYIVGDTVSLTFRDTDDVYEITGVIETLVGTQWGVRVNTTDGDVKNAGVATWDIGFLGNEVIFELKFPRFAYRWKYTDGEYSVFSPFTEVAFIPGDYEYNSEKGYNLAMTNNARIVNLEFPDTPPEDVVEIDLLYKESNNTVVYTVETLGVVTRASVDNEQIYAVLPDDQLLRPYDNVPRLAKAQDVTANRIVYGNYLHNYNVTDEPQFNVELINRANETQQSIKTLRTYQFGVVYQDKYGRQTPVLSNTSGSYQVPVINSNETTQFRVGLNSTPPEWATDYRFYVKEVSDEYYNLALDRYYTGEDGFVWLSFPSSEFNKIAQDSYIILKKQHSDSDAVTADDARYKVLDISTEAPDFLTVRDVVVTSFTYDNNIGSNNLLPTANGIQFTWKVNPNSSYYQDIRRGNTVKFGDGALTSDSYEIQDVADDANSSGNLTVTVNSLFTQRDVDIVVDSATGDLKDNVSIELSTEEREQLPEFIGRFFVKIIRNATFDTNVIDTSFRDTEKVYASLASQKLWDRCPPGNAKSSITGMFVDFREGLTWAEGAGKARRQRLEGEGIKVGSNKVDLSFAGTTRKGAFKPLWSYPFGDRIKDGALIRFLDLDGNVIGADDDNAGVYRINNVTPTAGPNLQHSNSGQFRRGYWRWQLENRRATSYKRWSLTLDRPISARFTEKASGDPFEEVVSTLVAGVGARVDRGGVMYDANEIGSIEIVRDLTEINRTREGGTPYVSDPAIFETEPKDGLLDIYHETQETYGITTHSEPKELRWFNCFSFGNGVESDRIRDDFNAVRIDKGPRVSTTIAEQFMEERLPSGLIWSGIFNSVSGINNTNQFILAAGIQKFLQPLFGSIQRLHARDTNLISFCEDKVVRILSNKDALFNADGSSNLTASNAVLGQTTPYTGEYGISKNPESFATFGSRIYFADKNRGVILRLSQDGLTEVSSKGCEDFFRDNFKSQTGPIIGSYDDYHDVYNITFDNYSVTYHEHTDGWSSRKSFIPESGLTLNNSYYTFKDGRLWLHNSDNVPRNNFYGTQYESSIVFIFNDQPGSIKNFKTINYEGTQPKSIVRYDVNDNPECLNTVDGGWFCPTFITDQQVGDARAFLKKENKWFADMGVLGGAEAVLEVLDTFDNLDADGSMMEGGEDGPLLEDESTIEDLMDRISEDEEDSSEDGSDDGSGGSLDDAEDSPFDDDFEDGELIGEIDNMEEVDEDGNPLPDQNSDRETTITVTIN